MDLEQRFTEELMFELEEAFLEKMRACDTRLGMRIASAIDKLNGTDIPIDRDEFQIFGGRARYRNEDNFFAVEIWKDSHSIIIINDIFTISADNYLDLYNENKIINQK